MNYMELAEEYAKDSPDPKMKVGCVILIEKTNTVVSGAYNGNPEGMLQERESLESGKSGYLHAELRAILNNHYSNMNGFTANHTLFVTLPPCSQCCKIIAEYKLINKVVYKDHPDYSKAGLELLKQVGIEVIKYEENHS